MCEESKICSKCGIEKLLCLDNFRFMRYHNLWCAQCKDCEREYKRSYRKKNREKVRTKTREYEINNAEKIKQRKHQYYLDNKDAILKRTKKYQKENRKKELERERKYRAKNIEKIRKYQKEHQKNMRKSNPAYRVRQNIGRRVRELLFKTDNYKDGSFFNYVDYTLEHLKRHLESQFELWMTWDNYGAYRVDNWDDNDSSTWTWQIDHIIPQSLLPYDSMEHQNFKKCWALNNLRPYSAKQNLADGARES